MVFWLIVCRVDVRGEYADNTAQLFVTSLLFLSVSAIIISFLL